VAKRKTTTRKATSRPSRTPIGPVAPPPMIGRLQSSGMMRYGDGEGQTPPALNVAARARKPTGRKVASPPPPTAVPTKDSGMTRMGDMLSQSPEDIAAMLRNRPGGKPASRKGCRK
jgi:hypothetical protein